MEEEEEEEDGGTELQVCGLEHLFFVCPLWMSKGVKFRLIFLRLRERF